MIAVVYAPLFERASAGRLDRRSGPVVPRTDRARGRCQAFIADDDPARRQNQLDFAPIRSSYPLDFGDVVVIHSYPLDSSDAKFGLW